MKRKKLFKNELKMMSKEKLIWQIEQLQKEIQIQAGRALKYYTGFELIMKEWDHIPDDKKPEIHDKLKKAGL